MVAQIEEETMKICKKCKQKIKSDEKEIDGMHEMCFVSVDERTEREDRI
jgi:hypothetical protein